MLATTNNPNIDGIQRTKTRVRVVMNAGILEGDHAHPAGVRLSDSLRNAASSERYLVLSDVTLHHLDGTVAQDDLSHAPFVLVNTAHVHAIIPSDQP